MNSAPENGMRLTCLQALQEAALGEGVEEGVVAALHLGPLALVLAGARLPVSAAPVVRSRQQRMHPGHHFRHHLDMLTVSGCYLHIASSSFCGLACWWHHWTVALWTSNSKKGDCPDSQGDLDMSDHQVVIYQQTVPDASSLLFLAGAAAMLGHNTSACSMSGSVGKGRKRVLPQCKQRRQGGLVFERQLAEQGADIADSAGICSQRQQGGQGGRQVGQQPLAQALHQAVQERDQPAPQHPIVWQHLQ